MLNFMQWRQQVRNTSNAKLKRVGQFSLITVVLKKTEREAKMSQNTAFL